MKANLSLLLICAGRKRTRHQRSAEAERKAKLLSGQVKFSILSISMLTFRLADWWRLPVSPVLASPLLSMKFFTRISKLDLTDVTGAPRLITANLSLVQNIWVE